jgi:acyl-coenzyme A synthetase/AMP-(fatty) acid ligase
VIASVFLSLEGWASRVHLIPPDVDLDAIADQKIISEFSATLEAKKVMPTVEIDTKWVLYTSGTTGEPKPIEHSLQSLARTVSKGKKVTELVWGMIYDPNRMAGIQVLLQAIYTRTRIVSPNSSLPIGERIQFMKDNDVNSLSATPTVWRQVLQCPQADDWDLSQITLGGEIADQKILDSLWRRFPNARIAHIFASTETGAAFAVNDLKAGFPAEYLIDAPKGIQIEIRDNILFVKNDSMVGQIEDPFISTGDVVEIVDDRVLFKGRSSGQVNIGGSKVWPEAVEAILRMHHLVLESRVSSKPNAFSGNILTAQVVLNTNSYPGIESELRKWIFGHAGKQHVPATISIVDNLETTSSGKVRRK